MNEFVEIWRRFASSKFPPPLPIRISKVGNEWKEADPRTKETDSSEKIVELSNIDTRQGNWDIFTPFRRES